MCPFFSEGLSIIQDLHSYTTMTVLVEGIYHSTKQAFFFAYGYIEVRKERKGEDSTIRLWYGSVTYLTEHRCQPHLSI